jgi:hypothetical protein
MTSMAGSKLVVNTHNKTDLEAWVGCSTKDQSTVVIIRDRHVYCELVDQKISVLVGSLPRIDSHASGFPSASPAIYVYK